MAALATTALVAGAAAKGASAIAAGVRAKKARKSLAELQKKKMERYSVDPKVKQIYEQAAMEAAAPRGFGGSAVSGFRNMLAKSNRGRFANAISLSGGSGARGVNAVLAGQQGEDMTNFATANENIMRANRNQALNRMQQGASQFQRTRDQNTANDINYRMLLERALGGAVSSNRDYMTNTISGLGSDLITAGIMGFDGKSVQGEDITEEVLPKGPGIDYNRLTPRSRFLMGRNPFRQSTGLTDGTLTKDKPMKVNTSGQSKFMYGNK
jgi:hypothetical protein